MKLFSKQRNLLFFEILIFLVCSIFAFYLSSYFDLFENLVEYMHQHEEMQLDELIIVGLVVIVLLSFFLVNRARLQYRLIQQLEKLSHEDALTHLYNRHMINKTLDNRIKEATRYNRDFSVLLFDIDNFKQINDTYGHLKGDDILKKISKLLVENLRETDIIGRWGGEEFIVICEINGAEATNVAEKLRMSIEEFFEKEKLPVTASFGVVQYQNHLDGKQAEKLLSRADKLLYMAKDCGKNCVIHAALTH